MSANVPNFTPVGIVRCRFRVLISRILKRTHVKTEALARILKILKLIFALVPKLLKEPIVKLRSFLVSPILVSITVPVKIQSMGCLSLAVALKHTPEALVKLVYRVC